MTGFGDANTVHDGVAYAVELRSLNNRYFKAAIRLPEELLSLEPELELLLRKRITRGSVTLTVSFKDTSAKAAYEINEAALQSYLSHLEHIEQKALADMGDRGSVTIDLAALLALPGIVQPPDQVNRLGESRGVLSNLLNKAADKLIAMRESEGQGLAADLVAHAKSIGERLQRIAERAPSVVEEYHQRLRQRIVDMLSRAQLQVNEPDLIREVAVYAERCDISEEVQRLSAHLEQFSTIIQQDNPEPAGRTLDFITQEMLREANTIGSKSNDATISRLIVEIKGSIDRMKEQVQNVE
jgi:uncharacterized protein (TIGR00255 family)